VERITDVENLIRSEHPRARSLRSHRVHRLSQITAPLSLRQRKPPQKEQGTVGIKHSHHIENSNATTPPPKLARMRVSRPKKWLIVTVVGVAAVAGGGVAAATQTDTVLTDTHPAGGSANEVRMRIQRSDFVPSADQPTFSSGWHKHPGPVLFQVQEGRVSITQGPPCRTTELGPGETYVEIPELPVLATAKRAAKFTASQFLAADEPPLTPTDAPC
jgi:hypothetical protein